MNWKSKIQKKKKNRQKTIGISFMCGCMWVTIFKRPRVLFIESEILCIEHTCENKWKQSHGWTEMWVCYEMIYADAHMRYSSVNLESEEIQSVTGVPVSGWVPSWDSGTQQASGWVLPLLRNRSAKWSVEDNTAWYGQEKKIWVNMAVSIRLPLSFCVSHTTEDLTPVKNKVWVIFL